MSEGTVHLALFVDIDPATQAIDKLREMGIPDQDMTIISSIPYSDKMLGRPMSWTRVPAIGAVGFFVGVVISLLLNFGTPWQYPIRVGNMPIYPVPTTLVLTFELAMLGLLAATFLGVIWESAFPSRGPRDYRPEISDGKIGLIFTCPRLIHDEVHETMNRLGAQWMHSTEGEEL